MISRYLFAFLLLLVAWVTVGCAGVSNYQSSSAAGSSMNDCNGDLPSPFPPYCRPVHN